METFELSVSFDQIWTCFLGSNVSVFEIIRVCMTSLCMFSRFPQLSYTHSFATSFGRNSGRKKPPFCQVAMMPQTCGEMASGRLTASWCWGKHGKARSIPWQTTSLIYILYIFYIYFIYFLYRLSILKDFEPPFERYIIQIHTAYLCIFHFKAKIKCYWS
jgi:hypothetical protein